MFNFKTIKADRDYDMSMERFGELLLMERLASGGMAEVFRAKQLGYAGFEKTVAVKRILPHFASSEDFKSMFRIEANLSAMLQHPNITQVFSNGEHEGYLYLVMEFVDGKNLRQLLARADKVKLRIPIEVSCYIISESVKGLDYAHNYHDERTGEALSIVHRDVSPQNIMLGYEGSVKIVDFGIAKAASKSESTRAGVLKGKFGYMSPEQARGEPLDCRSDIFSAGIILWELITQRRLFTYEDEMKTLEKVRECKVPRPSEKNPTIPYALEKIVMRALEKDPANRYSTGAEFYSDLVRYMNDRHPNFIATDFTRFMKEFYKEEIQEEKKRREKLNMEAPAFMAENPTKKPTNTREKTGTKTDHNGRDADTQVSGVVEPQIPGQNIAVEAQPEDLRDMLNLDPSNAGAQANRQSISLQPGQTKKIQFHSLAKESGTNTQVPRATASYAPPRVPHGDSASAKGTRFARAGLVIVVLALGTYGALTYLPAMLGPQFANLFHEMGKQGSDGKEEPKAVAKNQPTDSVVQDPVDVAPVEEDPSVDDGRGIAAADLFIWEPKNYPSYGSVSINGVPDADMIFLNGKKLVDNRKSAIKTPVRDLKLPPGKYEMVLKNTVFGVSKTLNFEIEQNKSQKLEAILNKR